MLLSTYVANLDLTFAHSEGQGQSQGQGHDEGQGQAHFDCENLQNCNTYYN